jgi:transposase
MCKLQIISNFQAQFSFYNINENYDAFYAQFLSTDLGKIHQSFSFDELVKTFKIKEYKKGTSTFFSPKGKIGLMILKNYMGCSDKKLIEQLNGNINFQFFCDIVIPFENPITNFKIVSQIRCELSKTLKIREAQRILAKAIKKERATRLEGSFGNEKEHYNLRKIKARTKATEILWIFFGIHTANALEIGRRIQSQSRNFGTKQAA